MIRRGRSGNVCGLHWNERFREQQLRLVKQAFRSVSPGRPLESTIDLIRGAL
jgi:hypothetical protein